MKLILWPKHHNYSQNRAYPLAIRNSPLRPFSGTLVLQFARGPFYTFVDISLMVLYQLETIHLVYYNLIYSQNKNMGFEKFLTAFVLKTKHFPFYKHFSKPIPKPIYNQYKTPLSIFGLLFGFVDLVKNRGVGCSLDN